MFSPLEKELFEKGYSLIAGVDEAGRGALFGPLIAAAVILNPKNLPSGIKDSKKLSPEKRKEVFVEIVRTSIAWAVGVGSLEEIEEKNVLQATFTAMRQAIKRLVPKPQVVIVDGPRCPGVKWVKEIAVIGGDDKILSVAAASIVAKVVRDSIIEKMEAWFPGYNLISNKGYGTRKHRAGIALRGYSVYHRSNFNVKIDL